ncbi:hypothetical protein SNE40_018996 [Patella caerulea]|uniref:Uncharacterized protein n=2 Tax=Patella caerulea TaxID=87958 RepID=A0AAN8J5W0_PATCE
MTHNLIKKLRHMDFPECTREALQHLTSIFSSQDSVPGLSHGVEALAADICQEFILFKSKGKPQKTLPPIEELQLLQMLCTSFNEASQKSKYQIFNAIFCPRGDNYSSSLLTKLVSMALSISCSPVLDCAAIWAQERGCSTRPVQQLTLRLVEDYCLLFVDPSIVFQKLPSTSPLFVCNFITSVTMLYPFQDTRSVPPLCLLEHVTEWINTDCTLCCESVRQSRIHNNYSSPIPGLTGWCVRGIILSKYLLNSAKNSSEDSSKSSQDVELEKATKLLNLLSKLHLGLLQSLQFCQTNINNISQYLITVMNMLDIIHSLIIVCRACSVTPEEESLHTALERFSQVIQVSAVSGCLGVETGKLNEFRNIALNSFPRNRLLHMVLAFLTGENQQKVQTRP